MEVLHGQKVNWEKKHHHAGRTVSHHDAGHENKNT